MSLVRKLKPDRMIGGPLVALATLFIIGISAIAFGIRTAMCVASGLILLYSLYSLFIFVRTGNIPHLAAAAYQVFLASMAYLLPPYIGSSLEEPVEYPLFFVSGIVFFGFLLVYFVATRKIKWRGREIFELAGAQIEEVGDGYTSRPRPVGKLECSPEQVRSFARFAARHLIALPSYSAKNVTLTPVKMGEEFGRVLGLSGDFRDASWVNFDLDGEVSVHIAQKDYLEYRQPLAFDPLCAALGQVFIDFYELYQKGEGVRVIDRLDELKIPIFS